MIAVINGGHVSELGTHEELMALDGLYCSLAKLQVSIYIISDLPDC